MNNLELAAKAKDVATNYKTLYILGCFGAPMNSSNKKRYTSNYPYNAEAARKKAIESASADTFGFDCVCLIKGLLWGWNGDVNHPCGGATYKSNGVPDINANSIINVCSDISTDFEHIEIGELCWMDGHVGLYVGDGLSVECTPRWTNNVQFTACNRTLKGYNKRTWTKHGKLPYVTYVKTESAPDKKDDITKYVEWLNSAYKLKLDVSKGWTTEAEKASIKGYQITINSLFATSLIEDGIFKYEDYLEASAHPIKKGDKGNLVYILQGTLLHNGFDPKGIDGSFGVNTQAAVTNFQKAHNLPTTGTCGADCIAALFDVKLSNLAPAPNYAVKESLCLRESPIDGKVITVMPPEAEVVKLTNPWVKVSYNKDGKVLEGWASLNYLARI